MRPRSSLLQGIPLGRLLPKRGLCSRSEALRLILSGAVRAEGRVCREPLRRFPASVPLSIQGREGPASPAPRVVLALHKPRGYVTTERDPEGRPTVFDLLPLGLPRLVAVGRLDRASRGLLLFTNDTALADRLTSPARHVPKTYHAKLDRILGPAEVDRLASGVTLENGERTRPCRVRLLRSGKRSCWIEVVLEEGLNRQVRRMAEAVGAGVTDLVRVSIGGLALGDLKAGKAMALTPPATARLLA